MLGELLAPYQSETEWTIDALVNLAAEIIPKVAGPQERHKVTEVPDPRTVRYYIQEGLVDRPHGFSGSTSLFGYRHLLQLLAIKVLQSRFLPIRKIKEEIRNLKTEELEAKVEFWVSAPVQPWLDEQVLADAAPPEREMGVERPKQEPDREAAQRYLESLPGRPAVAERIVDPGRAREARASWSRMAVSRESTILRQDVAESSSPEEQHGDITGSAVTASGWRRFELFPGIEVHVREGAEVPEGPSFPSVLASRLRVILEHIRRRS